MIRKLMTALCALAALAGCRIQPPLNLATDSGVGVRIGEVVTNLDVIWNTQEDWRAMWWYGWDAEDIRLWGDIAYPEPTNFEGRFYYFGLEPSTTYKLEKNTYYTRTIKRRFELGYHNILVWSNVDTPDGTQALIVDESDADNIKATTSRSRLSYAVPPSRATEVYNNPEVFFSGCLDNIYISNNVEDYDYYDDVLNAWVMELETDLYPMVYIYLVQVVVYNNHGLVTGLTDNAAINNMADGVDVRTGHTSNLPVVVSYEMGFKHDRPARDGIPADIFGGKMTTFGLCDMEPWSKSRVMQYAGSRSDLDNYLSVSMHFNNSTDSAYYYRVTDQIQRQSHGGIITIEIDADTLKIPETPNQGPGSVFDPVVTPTDSITYEFPM